MEDIAMRFIDYSDFIDKDIYEFGVYNGDSIQRIKDVCKQKNIYPNKMYGFDSFEGCPLESNDERSSHNWPKNFMNVQEKFYKNYTPQGVCSLLENKLKDSNFKLVLIKGWYKEVLNETNIKAYNMKPASFINIDCDQYTSTIEVLEFMFKNKLVEKNTIIRYDDWNSGLIYDGNIKNNGGKTWIEYKSGQSLAHKQMCEKYNINTTRLYHDNPEERWKGKSIFVVN